MDSEQRNTNTVNRILILIAMVLGAIIGVMSASHFYTQKEYASLNEKIGNVLTLVQDNYVDTVDIDSVGDRMIAAILSELDPHCTYLSARDAERTEELMRGNFEGVGIVLHREGDTTFIGQILDDGPSSASGLLPGDLHLGCRWCAGDGDACRLCGSTVARPQPFESENHHQAQTLDKNSHHPSRFSPP